MKAKRLLSFALAAALAAAASAATVRKADDSTVEGQVVGVEDGKVLLARSAPTPDQAGSKLSGTAIGTDGSWNDEGNSRENALDGNLKTFFDAPSEMAWVGLDLGAPKVITQIRFCPRPSGNSSFAQRMVGGKFQGSNTADFSAGVVDLLAVGTAPPENAYTTSSISIASPFRYVRYISPEKGYGNVAEVEFWGHAVAAPTAAQIRDAARIPLEDVAIITLREKPRPAEPAPTAQEQAEQAQSVIGGVFNFLFGGPRADRRSAQSATTPAPGVTTTAAATQPGKPAGAWQIRLQGEDRWTGQVTAWSEKKISFAPDASPEVTIDVPVERVRAVWKGTPALVAQARAMQIQSNTEDVAFIEKDGQVHNVKGLVVGIQGQELVFRFSGADRKINLGRLVGIQFASPQVVHDQVFHQAVELMSGDVISGLWKSMAGGKVGIETSWGKTLEVPLDSVANIQCRNGKLVYLSDLSPANIEQVPYFDRLFSYRNDQSLVGGVLRLIDGVYDKGVAVHSRCVLSYDIGGKFEQFKAHVGFQQPEGAGGQCVIRLLADGRVLFENTDARGDRPPVDVAVDVKGAARLTLEVDFGQGQDVGDRVVWANARLVRAAVQR